MRAIFIGLGSIGQRHLRNLLDLAPRTQVFALRSGDSPNKNKVIENGGCTKVCDLDEYYGIRSFETLGDALSCRPDIAFITNPSSLHVSTALEFAKNSCHLFIEKPLGHNLDLIPELESVIAERDLVSYVAYQTRFSPIIHEAERIVAANSGKMKGAHFEWKTFLPSFHSYEDYAISYAARSDLGGGAVLNLSHEIDLAYHLFGVPSGVAASGGRHSDLNIDVEDTVSAVLEYERNGLRCPVRLDLSLAQPVETRSFRISFENLTFTADLIKNVYTVLDERQRVIAKHQDSTHRDELFRREMRHFLDCVRKREKTSLDVSEGKKSLELALQIKQSLIGNRSGPSKEEKQIK